MDHISQGSSLIFPWASHSALTQANLSIFYRYIKYRYLCRETDMRHVSLWMPDLISPAKKGHLERVQVEDPVPLVPLQLPCSQVRCLALYQATGAISMIYSWCPQPENTHLWNTIPEYGHGSVLQSSFRHPSGSLNTDVSERNTEHQDSPFTPLLLCPQKTQTESLKIEQLFV